MTGEYRMLVWLYLLVVPSTNKQTSELLVYQREQTQQGMEECEIDTMTHQTLLTYNRREAQGCTGGNRVCWLQPEEQEPLPENCN